MKTRSIMVVVAVCACLGAVGAWQWGAWRGPVGEPQALVFSSDASENDALTVEFNRRMAKLGAEQQAGINAWESPHIKLSLARLDDWFVCPAYDTAAMQPFLADLESYPLDTGGLAPGTGLFVEQYAGEIAIQAAIIAVIRFDVPAADRRRFAAGALRSAKIQDNEIISMRAATLLTLLRDTHPTGTLSPAEEGTLRTLMENEWNRTMVERQVPMIKDVIAARAAAQ